MRARRFIAFAALCAACAGGEPQRLRLIAVEPVQGADDAATELTILGAGFRPQVRTDFSRPEQSSVDASFRVALVPEDPGRAEHDLGEAQVLSPERLRIVLPPGLPRGFYGLRVQGPRGAVGELREVFRVVRAQAHVAAFAVEPVGAQRAGVPFVLRVSAVDGSGEVVDGFSGSAFLSDKTGTLSPAETGPFALGRARLQVTVATVIAEDVIEVADAEGRRGHSPPFAVVPGMPSQAALSAVPAALAAGSCSERIVLELRDAQGLPAPAESALPVELAAAPPDRFRFYSDAGCTAAVEALQLAAGESAAGFFVRGEQAGTVTLRALPRSLPLASATVVIATGPPARVEFASPSQRLALNGCSAPVRLHLVDLFANPSPPPARVELDLAAHPAGSLAAFADAACQTALPLLALEAGEPGAVVHVRGVVAGTAALRAVPRASALGQGELVFTVSP